MNPRDLLRRLGALAPYPAQDVVRGRERLAADANDPLDDLTPFARDEARKLFETIEEMKRRSGGGV
jgi:hypothetical protein